MHIHTAKAGRPGGTSLLIGSEGLAYGDPPTGPVPTGHISAGPDFMPLLLTYVFTDFNSQASLPMRQVPTNQSASQLNKQDVHKYQ